MPDLTTAAWDLSDLFAGIDDPKIEKSLDDSLERAKEFAAKYRGKIDSDTLTAQTLFNSISEYESMVAEMAKPAYYASLVFAADTSKPEHGALMQHVQERGTEIALELMFFDLELMAAKPEIIDSIIDNTILTKYRHFIKAARLFRSHRLSEPEEIILEEKANTGGRAFERLFEESVSAIEFKVILEGEENIMTEPEVLALLRNPDRKVRKTGADALTKGLLANGHLLTFIFNTLLYDKSVDDRLRRYEYPEQARNLSNELDMETVETVISTCADNYSLVARYYRIKREILGLDKLTHYDRYAPLFEAKEQYSWDQAKDIVLTSFGDFSKEIAAAASEFFDKNWIDAASRKGKRGGAFCSYTTPDNHPYILLSYLNKVDDIMTLGHELGHGIHAYLARPQGYLNFSSALPVAELASTFGEMLVFQNIAEKLNLDDKMALYAEKIESIFATIFRQASMFRFEQELHRARREEGELTADDIGEIWQRNIQAMFLDSVEMGEDHKNWWMYVSHFVGSPFYVYAYSFGELLVMALYAMYKEQGEAFVPKFIELLKTGGACSPQELLARVGIDIKSPEFWQGGVKVVEQIVADFEKLHAQWSAAKG
ncbi:MAG: M3 family oligoendopeptidase [Armatimonadetes bacterium]|nr:M3 family oligoendopeptidase [Armatimonadota bacterium]